VQRRCWGGGWQHTRQTLEKSPTSKLYTTWAHILIDRNVFAPRGEGENGRVQCPWGFSCFSWFFSAFFWWSLAPDFHSAKITLAGNLLSFSVYSPEFS